MALYSGLKQKLNKLLKRKKAMQPNLLTKLTINQVQHIQTQHSDWLDPQRRRGKKANFKMCKLPIAARFGGSYDGVSFQGSYLRGIFFKGASLLSSDFREANLQDTDFSDAVGLSTESIAGADVTNSKLPEEIKEFKTLEVLSEASRNARKLFLIMLLACVYSIITIGTTTDVRLITNSASSPLPIIGAEIPIVSFFLVMPLFLVGIYIYFQISMQRIWEGLAKLPAIFPDGIPLDQKVYPWLLLGLVRNHFSLLKKIRPSMHRLQTLISSLLAWWVVPGTLIMFWLRFLPRHDWWGTGFHVGLITIIIGFGWKFHRICVQTLRWENITPIHFRHKILKRLSELAFTLLGMSFFLLVSYRAINGTGLSFSETVDLNLVRAINRNNPSFSKPIDIRSFIPRVLERFAFGAFADLRDADISSKPLNWTGYNAEGASMELAQVKGAQLSRANLRYANATSAFLAKASFSDANLENVILRAADLRQATFLRVNLSNADLSSTSLNNARFTFVKLDSADFRGADLLGTRFVLTSLRGANLTDIKNWRDIKEMGLANISGVIGSPKGFLAWADSMGAVSIKSDEEWEALKMQRLSRFIKE